MNLAVLHPVAGPRTPGVAYRDEVAVLLAVLQRAGHAVTFLMYWPEEAADARSALADARPDLVLIYIEPLAADLSRRAAGDLASAHAAPVIAFGPHARQMPGECLSLAGAEAVCVGPADACLPAYLDARKAGLDATRVRGFWVTLETGVMRNPPPRPPESLADRPPPLRTLYPFDQLLDPAGLGAVTVCCGGEQPPPPAGAPPSTDAPWPPLRRPVDACLDEMAAYADEQLDLSGWRVGNTRWASDPAWLEEFADKYVRRIHMPLRTTLHAADVTGQVASLLAMAGCMEAGLRLGSASDLVRNEVLRLGVTQEALGSAIEALRGAGVRTAVGVEVGSPYETPVTLDETVALLSRLDPDRVDVALHYPAPGTHASQVARENGWLTPDPAAAHLAGRPALALRSLSDEAVLEAHELLADRVYRPGLVPLLRLARRVRLGPYGTLYELAVKPMLPPPRRRGGP
jgi:hypothetical protein